MHPARMPWMLWSGCWMRYLADQCFLTILATRHHLSRCDRTIGASAPPTGGACGARDFSRFPAAMWVILAQLVDGHTHGFTHSHAQQLPAAHDRRRKARGTAA